MIAQIRGYLYDVSRRLHLDPGVQHDVVSEFQAHLEDRAQELMDDGASQEAAIQGALQALGRPKGIASAMYSVHSRATWWETAIAVTPHILFAILFAFHLWTIAAWMGLLLAASAVMAFRGWKKGRPSWTYSWLGYCLIVPAFVWFMALASIGYGAWSLVSRGTLPLAIPVYIASLVYLPVALWVLVWLLSSVIRRDWLLASLMAWPFPFLTYWLLYIKGRGDFFSPAGSTFQQVDTSTAFVFVILAVVTALFLRIGQRLLRVALVLITAPALAILAWVSYQGGPGYLAMVFFFLFSVIFLLSPALLEGRLHEESSPELLGEGESA